ncbi:MAG: zinc ribbon domain-containing protein [Candidatus Omnitrophota bacterium]
MVIINYCTKCGKKLSKEYDFCPECGNRIINIKKKEILVTTQKQTESSNKSIWWIIILIAVLIIFVIVSIVCFLVPFSYSSTEAYYEKEPSALQEQYTESVIKYRQVQSGYDESIRPLVDEEGSYYSLLSPGFNVCTGCYVSLTIEANYPKVPFRYIISDQFFECNKIFSGEDVPNDVQNIDLSLGTLDVEDREIGPINTDSTLCFAISAVGPPGNNNQNIYSKIQINQIRKTPIMISEPYETSEIRNRTVTNYKDVKKERNVTKYASIYKIWTKQVDFYYVLGQE